MLVRFAGYASRILALASEHWMEIFALDGQLLPAHCVTFLVTLQRKKRLCGVGMLLPGGELPRYLVRIIMSDEIPWSVLLCQTEEVSWRNGAKLKSTELNLEQSKKRLNFPHPWEYRNNLWKFGKQYYDVCMEHTVQCQKDFKLQRQTL